MLAKTRIDIPWWLWVIIILEMLPMFVGPYVALTNPRLLGGPEAESITYAAFIYASRNIAVGCAFVVAVWLRNAPMLFALIAIRFVTDLGDLATFLLYELSENPGRLATIFVVFYYVPAVIALRYLWQRMTASATE